MDFILEPEQLGEVGQGFVHPECVLATARGDLYISHFGGGVSRLTAAGVWQDILGPGAPKVQTNGFALTPAGDLLCAHLMARGGV